MLCLIALCGSEALAADLATAVVAAPHGTITKYHFAGSKIFPGTQRDYWVYVPKQYDGLRPACLHVNQDGIQFNAPAVFDELIEQKQIPVTIGVFVAPGIVKATSPVTVDRFNRSYEYDGLGDAYVRFLLEELLPDVEKRIAAGGQPIRISRDPNDRSIAGSSSGAICAFTAAWERPDAFRRVFSAVGTYVGLRGGNDYPTLIRKMEPKPLRVFLQDGSDDLNIYAGDWWMANQEMDRALQFAGYEVNHAWGDGGHDGKHAMRIFADAMRWLWKDWPAPVKAGSGSQQFQEILMPGEQWERVPGEYHSPTHLTSNDRGEVVFLDSKHHKLLMVNPHEGVSPYQFSLDTNRAWAPGPHGRRYAVAQDSGLLSVTDRDGESAIVARASDCRDMIVAHDGSIFLSSPSATAIGSFELWRVSPAGEKLLVESAAPHASALCLTADQSCLLVADGNSHWIYSYQLQPDGRLAHEQPYYHLHVPDTADDSGAASMCVDRDGRLYVATRMGIQVCDQTGRVNCILPLPAGAATSVCFGGAKFNVLYASSSDGLFRRKLKAIGAPAFQPPVKLGLPRL